MKLSLPHWIKEGITSHCVLTQNHTINNPSKNKVITNPDTGAKKRLHNILLYEVDLAYDDDGHPFAKHALNGLVGLYSRKRGGYRKLVLGYDPGDETKNKKVLDFVQAEIIHIMRDPIMRQQLKRDPTKIKVYLHKLYDFDFSDYESDIDWEASWISANRRAGLADANTRRSSNAQEGGDATVPREAWKEAFTNLVNVMADGHQKRDEGHRKTDAQVAKTNEQLASLAEGQGKTDAQVSSLVGTVEELTRNTNNRLTTVETRIGVVEMTMAEMQLNLKILQEVQQAKACDGGGNVPGGNVQNGSDDIGGGGGDDSGGGGDDNIVASDEPDYDINNGGGGDGDDVASDDEACDGAGGGDDNIVASDDESSKSVGDEPEPDNDIKNGGDGDDVASDDEACDGVGKESDGDSGGGGDDNIIASDEPDGDINNSGGGDGDDVASDDEACDGARKEPSDGSIGGLGDDHGDHIVASDNKAMKGGGKELDEHNGVGGDGEHKRRHLSGVESSPHPKRPRLEEWRTPPPLKECLEGFAVATYNHLALQHLSSSKTPQ